MFKFKQTRILIGIISLILSGLIAIQAYWIINAIKLEEKQFSSEVFSVLNRLSNKLEKRMVFKMVINNPDAKFLCTPDSINCDSIISDPLNKDFDFRVEDKQIIPVKKYREKIIIITDSSDKKKNIARKIKVEVNDSHSKLIVSKAKIIEEVIDEMIKGNSIPDSTYSPANLSKMLQEELITSGINTPFVFALLDENNKIRHSASNDTNRLLNSSYQINLLRNSILPEKLFLKLYFPNQKGFLLQKIILAILLSCILTLLLIAVFTVTILSLVKQKKIAEIRNDFINNMTHEFKTPITTISLATQALSDPEISEQLDKEKNIHLIGEESLKLSRMVDYILYNAQIERKETVLKITEVNLEQLVMELLESLRLLAESRQASIITNYSKEGISIKADAFQMRIMLLNLIENALKYSDNSPEISISVCEEADNILISIKDNGQGIPLQYQNEIFERFFRIPTGNIHNVKGFGLGLNYVKQIVEQHHGSISLESKTGEGSTFTITLPKL